MERGVGLAGETSVVGRTVAGETVVGALVAVSSVGVAEVESCGAGTGVRTLSVDAVGLAGKTVGGETSAAGGASWIASDALTISGVHVVAGCAVASVLRVQQSIGVAGKTG